MSTAPSEIDVGGKAEAGKNDAETAPLDAFLLFNGREKGIDRIAAGLGERGVNAHFWDGDAPIGSGWESLDENQLNRARTVVVFLGGHGWGPTHERHAQQARAENKRLVPVLIGDPSQEALSRVDNLFSALTYLDLRQVDEYGLDRLAAAILDGRGPERAKTSAAASASVTVRVVDEGTTAVRLLMVTPDLAAAIARASAIRGGRNSFDLSFSSLLLGLVTGNDPTGRWLARYLKSEQVKLDHVYRKVQRSPAAVTEAVQLAMANLESELQSPKRQSTSARRALVEANDIANAQGSGAIDVKHLVAAFAALADYHEEDFGSLGLDRPRWAAAFVRNVVGRSADPDERTFWTRFYERRFPGHALPDLDAGARRSIRPDYDADGYTQRDLLDIDDEVRSLSYVISAVKTSPPMAIGLFGEWGSGKTFFMRHLRRRIEHLCAGARAQKPAERACHGQIAQIEFNAWHYQEGDLWASLVDHILRNLRFGENEDETKLAERRDSIVRQLGKTEENERTASAQEEDAKSRIRNADERLTSLQNEEKQKREDLAKHLAPKQLLAAARAGVTLDAGLVTRSKDLLKEVGVVQAGAAATDLLDALTVAKQDLSGLAATFAPLQKATDRRKRLALMIAAIAAPILVGLVVDWALSKDGNSLIGKLTGVVTWLGTFLVAGERWLHKQHEWTQKLRARIDPVLREVDRQIETEVESKLAGEKHAIVDQLEELENLKQQQAAATKAKEAAAAEAAALRRDLTDLGSDRLLRAFLDERLGGGEYQKRLGFASLVRRDFERLSTHVREVTKREAEGTLRDGELVINRIVLYIDDLDRCDHKQVVAVLRAVHLLLAFPAFVVVVGVDSRWVAQCLRKHIREIMVDDAEQGERRATPIDYLEKIFQIPIWLEPVPPARRARMAQVLLNGRASRPEQRDTGERAASEQPSEPGKAPDGGGQSKDSDGGQGPAGAKQPEGATVSSPASPRDEEHEEHLDLNPSGLDITNDDSAFLRRLGDLLSPSPRSIKRFVNTLRLINVGLAEEALDDHGAQPLDAEIRMFLLAICVGKPGLSRELQMALAPATGPHDGRRLTDVIEHYFETRTPAGTADEGADRTQTAIEWASVKEWMHARGKAWVELEATRVATWLDPVARYTFNLTRSPPALRGESGAADAATA